MSRIITNALFAAHFTGDNNGTVFTEETGLTISKTGTVITSTAQSKFNPASLYFNGSASYLTASNILDFSGDFWLECWVYITALPTIYVTIFDGRPNSGDILGVMGLYKISNILRPDFSLSPGNRVSASSTSVSLNGWHLVVIARSSNVIMLFVDGVKDATTRTVTGNLTPTGSILNIGRLQDPSYCTGYFSDLLVLPTCLHTSSYTPETETWTYSPPPFKSLTYQANPPSDAIEICQDIVPKTRYVMQGVDSLGTIVQWIAYNPTATPNTTTPAATGAITSIRIVAEF